MGHDLKSEDIESIADQSFILIFLWLRAEKISKNFKTGTLSYSVNSLNARATKHPRQSDCYSDNRFSSDKVDEAIGKSEKEDRQLVKYKTRHYWVFNQCLPLQSEERMQLTKRIPSI